MATLQRLELDATAFALVDLYRKTNQQSRWIRS